MSDDAPNVLLVVLDSVRAANCSLYGASRETTPFLSSLADEATTYTQARAPSNWTLPSHVSLLTGLPAHEHRVSVRDRLRPGHTVVEDLAGAGYDTGVFTANEFVAGPPWGVADAFETVVGTPEAFDDRYATGTDEPDGFYFADELLSWTADADGPWMACLNLMDAHRPYHPRERHDRWGDPRAREIQDAVPSRWEWTFHGGERPYWQLGALEALYDGGVRQADAVLARVVDRLRDRGTLDDTLLVVAGDHGDGFGEPGRVAGEPRNVAHIVPTGEELLHVPLLVRPPGGGDGRRVDDLAALDRFPAVVRDHVDGLVGGGRFAVDRAHATKQPVTGDLREKYETHCEDPGRFVAASHAVYEDAPGRAVEKRYHWGDAAATIRVHAPGVVERVGGADTDRLRAASDGADPGVRAEDAADEVSDAAKSRLEALGYY